MVQIISYSYRKDPFKIGWRAMDKSEHFAIYKQHGEFIVVKGEGLPSECGGCPETHEIDPDEYLGSYEEGWNACERLIDYWKERYLNAQTEDDTEDAPDWVQNQIEFKCKHPREHEELSHPRGNYYMA